MGVTRLEYIVKTLIVCHFPEVAFPNSPIQLPWLMSFRLYNPIALPLNGVQATVLLTSVASLFAGNIGAVALVWWVSRTGGASDLIVIFTVQGLVSFVATPLLTPVVETLRRSHVLLMAGLLVSLRGAFLAYAAWFGIYDLWAIVGLHAVNAAAMAAVLPLRQTMLADLSTPDQFVDLISIQSGCESAARFVGPLCAAALIAFADAKAALLAHAILSFASCLLLGRVDIPTPARRERAEGWLPEVVEGLTIRWRIPTERWILIIGFLQLVCFLPAVSILLPLKLIDMHLDGVWLGTIEGAASCGAIVAGFGMANALLRLLGRFAGLLCACAAPGLLMIAASWSSNPWQLVACYGGIGFVATVQAVAGLSHRTLATPKELRVRFAALRLANSMVAGSVAPTLAGVVIGATSTNGAFALLGGLLVLLTLATAFTPGLRVLLGLHVEEAEGWYAKAFPKAFETPS